MSYGIPSDGVTRYGATNQNFDFTPSLISMKAYEFTNDFIRNWMENDVVTEYLAKTIFEEAIRDWFDVINEETDDIHPKWKQWQRELKKMGFFKGFLRAFQSMKAFGIGVMNFTKANKFQIIEGDSITDIQLNIYDEPNSFKVQTNDGLKFYSAGKFDVMYKMPSYLRPIFDVLVYMKWITYSLAETAAREGSKFTVVWTKAQDEALQNKIRTEMVGLSSRKLAVASHAVIDDIAVLDTKTNADIANFLEPLYNKVSLKCRIPSAMLKGIQVGAVTGSETDIGGMYEAYALIQNEVEDLIIPLMEKYLDTELKGYTLKWKKAFRQSQDEIEAVLKVRADRHAVELGWKKINEVRHDEGLEPVEGGDIIPGFPGSTNVMIDERGTEAGIRTSTSTESDGTRTEDKGSST